LLDGKFEIRGLLGQGGMGQVFEAYDRELHRRVAIKIAWPHTGGSVRNEALALAAFRHPSLIAIYALGRLGNLEYVVMERVYGMTLEDYLEKLRAESRHVPLGEVVDILTGISQGLAVIHSAGVAHRDVKPANVMLAPGNRIVLTDFGIFRAEGPRRERDWCVGSPPYMAPETIVGSVSLGEEYLVDVYALGVVAYELLTGQLPFWTESVRALWQLHLNAPPPDPTVYRTDVPHKLASLVQAMLAKDTTARPQSMDEIAWQLARMRMSLPPAIR
jgi:serine/threonine-protein kinase